MGNHMGTYNGKRTKKLGVGILFSLEPCLFVIKIYNWQRSSLFALLIPNETQISKSWNTKKNSFNIIVYVNEI
jgi:hypothetical protein